MELVNLSKRDSNYEITTSDEDGLLSSSESINSDSKKVQDNNDSNLFNSLIVLLLVQIVVIIWLTALTIVLYNVNDTLIKSNKENSKSINKLTKIIQSYGILTTSYNNNINIIHSIESNSHTISIMNKSVDKLNTIFNINSLSDEDIININNLFQKQLDNNDKLKSNEEISFNNNKISHGTICNNFTQIVDNNMHSFDHKMITCSIDEIVYWIYLVNDSILLTTPSNHTFIISSDVNRLSINEIGLYMFYSSLNTSDKYYIRGIDKKTMPSDQYRLGSNKLVPYGITTNLTDNDLMNMDGCWKETTKDSIDNTDWIMWGYKPIDTYVIAAFGRISNLPTNNNPTNITFIGSSNAIVNNPIYENGIYWYNYRNGYHQPRLVENTEISCKYFGGLGFSDSNDILLLGTNPCPTHFNDYWNYFQSIELINNVCPHKYMSFSIAIRDLFFSYNCNNFDSDITLTFMRNTCHIYVPPVK